METRIWRSETYYAFAAKSRLSSSKESSYYFGDVFQRALILETLCDIQKKLDLNLESLIDYEIEYLVQHQRQDDVGGWAYFPEVLEIAADADDLGQVLQALVSADRNDLALTYCEKPIRTLLKHNLLENGAVETWIVPKTNRTSLQEQQHQYNVSKWGVGPDTEVMANLFYGLAKYDPQRFENITKKAVHYIESVQEPDGSWKSRWYFGSFYGTYVCSRLISHVSPDSTALTKAKSFLFQSRNKDGGWGNQLNTALALLALYYCDHKGYTNASLGLEWLKSTLTSDWQPIDFIIPRIGEPYKSKTITAMYVCKASATWNNAF